MFIVRKTTRQIVVRRRFEPPSIDNPHYVALPLFIFWQNFFDNIILVKYQISTKLNSCGKVILHLQNTKNTIIYMLSYKQHFYKQHQAEIWSEIIASNLT